MKSPVALQRFSHPQKFTHAIGHMVLTYCRYKVSTLAHKVVNFNALCSCSILDKGLNGYSPLQEGWFPRD